MADGLYIHNDGQWMTIGAAPPLAMTITIPSADGTPLVTIRPTGELEYGPNYAPDEAARMFWEALSGERAHWGSHQLRAERDLRYCQQQLKAAEDELAQWRQRAVTRPVEIRPLVDGGPSAADLASATGYAPKDASGNCPDWCPCHKMEATP